MTKNTVLDAEADKWFAKAEAAHESAQEAARDQEFEWAKLDARKADAAYRVYQVFVQTAHYYEE